MDRPIYSEHLNKFLSSYGLTVEITVKDAECGGGKKGDIKPHRHENTNIKLIGNMDNVATVLPMIAGRQWSFDDHGQRLAIVLDFNSGAERTVVYD